MSARDWRSLLSDAPGPFALVDSMRDYLTSHFEVWTYDQVHIKHKNMRLSLNIFKLCY